MDEHGCGFGKFIFLPEKWIPLPTKWTPSQAGKLSVKVQIVNVKELWQTLQLENPNYPAVQKEPQVTHFKKMTVAVSQDLVRTHAKPGVGCGSSALGQQWVFRFPLKGI